MNRTPSGIEAALTAMRKFGFSYTEPTPWVMHAAGKIEKNGHWADYGGWECWMGEQINVECPFAKLYPDDPLYSDHCMTCTTAAWWDDAPDMVKIMLYRLMSDACTFTADESCLKDSKP